MGLLSAHSCWQPFSMELITVLQGRLSADYRTDDWVSEYGSWISDLSFRVYGLQI